MSLIRDLGIRARLVMLTAAAVAPLFLLLIGGIVYAYGDAVERARIDVRKTAEIAAAKLSDTFQDARARLDMVRNLAEVRRGSGPTCDAFMTALQRANPQFLNIGLIDRDGRPSCSGRQYAAGVAVEADLIRRVLSMDLSGFSVGTFSSTARLGQNTVLAAMPLSYVRGVPTGVIYAAINLEHLLDPVRTLSDGGRRSVILMEAGSARVLARWPNPVVFGTVVPNDPLLPFVQAHPQGGVVELADLDGTQRIFGAAPVTDSARSSIMVLVGESRADTIAVVNFRSLVSLALALLVLGLAIVGTFWLGSEMLVKPMQRLVRMALRIGAGEFGARTEIERWQAPEFRELAATLDAMAVRLDEGRQAEKAMAASEARYRLLADNTADMITCLDAEGRRTFVSGASFGLLGYRPEELLGQSAESLAHPDDRKIVRSLATRLRARRSAPPVHYRALHRDGHYVWVDVSGRLIEGSDEMVFAIRDASHRKAMEEHLEAVNQRLANLAATDEVTGLPNRRSFNHALTRELSRCARAKTAISLVLIDIDRFKAYNDSYGHQAGDVCLRRVAEALGGEIGRGGDMVARYGGEEFVAVFPDATLSGALGRAEAMRRAVRDLAIPHDGSEHRHVTVSLGVACLFDASQEGATTLLLRQADQALYAAKAKGRDAIEAFPRESSDDILSRGDMPRFA